MTDIAAIVERLRAQHIEVAALAANAIERLVASEAQARAELAELKKKYARLLRDSGLREEPENIGAAGKAKLEV